MTTWRTESGEHPDDMFGYGMCEEYYHDPDLDNDGSRVIIPFQEKVDDEFLNWDFFQSLDFLSREELLEGWMVIAVFGAYTPDIIKACELLGKFYQGMPHLFDDRLQRVIREYRSTFRGE